MAARNGALWPSTTANVLSAHLQVGDNVYGYVRNRLASGVPDKDVRDGRRPAHIAAGWLPAACRNSDQGKTDEDARRSHAKI